MGVEEFVLAARELKEADSSARLLAGTAWADRADREPGEAVADEVDVLGGSAKS